MPSDQLAAMIPVVAAFERFQVRYYVGGSVASTAYGHMRTTQDVDFVADLALRHVTPLVQSLEGLYYVSVSAVSEAIKRRSCFNLIHLATSFKVDVFVPKERDYDRQVFDRIRRCSFDPDDPQRQFFVASPEDVVLAKLQWYRLGDEVSERQWLDVTRVIAVQRNVLDRSYLEKWAANLGVADLLERALA
jgi:hypothetical protein